MSRRLNVAPEVAKAMHPARLAQEHVLVDRDDNICPVCNELVLTDTAELVMLGEDGYALIRLTHPDCLASGLYAKPGVRELALKQAARTDKQLDLNTAVFIVPDLPRVRSFCVVEVVRMSGDVNSDPVEIWADEIGLPPFKFYGTGFIKRVKDARFRAGERGLELVYGDNVTDLGLSRPATLNWISQVDQGLAWLVVGRGLRLDKFSKEQDKDFTKFIESLGSIPCWGAPVRVQRAIRRTIPVPWRR